MKRSYRFVESVGTVQCALGPGPKVMLPVFPGILKHPTVDELRELLARPAVARQTHHPATPATLTNVGV